MKRKLVNRALDLTFALLRELHATLRGHVPCVNFGDLNIFARTEAYDDAVNRVTHVQTFLTEHLTAPPVGKH